MRRKSTWRFTAVMATRQINARAAETAHVIITLHAQEQMEKRDILAADLFRILREGQVHQEPSREGDEWKAMIEKRLPGGREAAAVTVVASGRMLRVVTVMWLDL